MSLPDIVGIIYQNKQKHSPLILEKTFKKQGQDIEGF